MRCVPISAPADVLAWDEMLHWIQRAGRNMGVWLNPRKFGVARRRSHGRAEPKQLWSM